jgi:hypothetical protein
MQVAIELPEDIGEELRAKWQDFPRQVLESVALEGYRSGALTAAQVRQLLGFKSRMEVDPFLKEHGVFLEYTLDDLDRDRKAHRQLKEIEKAHPR